MQNSSTDAGPATGLNSDQPPKFDDVTSPHSSKSKIAPVIVTPSEQHLLLQDKPQPPKPKPATWVSREPSGPWCPAELKEFLDFEMRYENNLQEHSPTIGQWSVTAATKRGRMHAHHGTHREDAYGWKSAQSFAIYCVCDGAGSAQLSRIGSEFAVRSICQQVYDELLAEEKAIQACSAASLHANLKSVLHHAIAMTAKRISEMADKSKHNANDFRCTVLTALHYRHPSGGFYVFGNVGDGFIALKRRGSDAERVGTSDSGNFSGEVLCFMPDHQVSEYFKSSLDKLPMFSDEDVEAVLLCTDGIEDPFFPVHKNIQAVYSQLEHGYESEICGVNYPESARPSSVLNSQEPAKELLKWLHFEKRGENDDRTLMLVHKRHALEAPPASKIVGMIGNASKKIDETGGLVKPSFAAVSQASYRKLIVILTSGVLGIVIGFLLGLFVFRGPSEELSHAGKVSKQSRLQPGEVPSDSRCSDQQFQ